MRNVYTPELTLSFDQDRLSYQPSRPKVAVQTGGGLVLSAMCLAGGLVLLFFRPLTSLIPDFKSWDSIFGVAGVVIGIALPIGLVLYRSGASNPVVIDRGTSTASQGSKQLADLRLAKEVLVQRIQRYEVPDEFRVDVLCPGQSALRIGTFSSGDDARNVANEVSSFLGLATSSSLI